MDDPGWSWPAWKFGLKRDDLFTSLHDRYNTFSYTIQDPEAFHHDVYEISRDADSSDEFHRLMADRQRQRLHELHESLESLAVEIIANPTLMASDQWQHALQLFRTKSYDSIVRFFASYLPDHYLDRHDARSTSSSFSEADTTYTASTKASSVGDAPCPFLDDDDFFPNGPAMTQEPCPFDRDVHSILLSMLLCHPQSPRRCSLRSRWHHRRTLSRKGTQLPTPPPHPCPSLVQSRAPLAPTWPDGHTSTMMRPLSLTMVTLQSLPCRIVQSRAHRLTLSTKKKYQRVRRKWTVKRTMNFLPRNTPMSTSTPAITPMIP